MSTERINEYLTQFSQMRGLMLEQLRRVVVGQGEVIEQILACVFTRGHCLLVGVPGLAKTLLVSSISQILDVSFKRIQFTPDLMPSDITGTMVLDEREPGKREFRFVRGPVFANIVLADEINRTPPKTQAALLQAMQEREVSAGQDTYKLPDPFFVIATQNPIEYEGTYPLPEAQLDRFLFKVLVPYPGTVAERRILERYDRGFDAHDLEAAGVQPVLTPDELRELMTSIAAVTVDDALFDYITAIVDATRSSPDLLLGASPRASIALLMTAKTLAAMRGRGYITPDDVKTVAFPTLRHRLVLKPEAEIEGLTPDRVIDRILTRIPVPR